MSVVLFRVGRSFLFLFSQPITSYWVACIMQGRSGNRKQCIYFPTPKLLQHYVRSVTTDKIVRVIAETEHDKGGQRSSNCGYQNVDRPPTEIALVAERPEIADCSVNTGVRCLRGRRRNYSITTVAAVVLTLCVFLWRYTSNIQVSEEQYTDELHVKHTVQLCHVEARVHKPYLIDEHYFLEPEIDQFYHYFRRNVNVLLHERGSVVFYDDNQSRSTHVALILITASETDYRRAQR